MNDKIFVIKSFIQYYSHACTRHSVHSPFVYNIVDEIVNDNKIFPEYSKIDHSLKSLASNSRIIEITDFGRSSAKSKYEYRLESIAHIHKTSSVSRKYGRLLFRLVRKFNPQTIIEIGTSLGVSTSYLALAAPEAKIISLEGCSVKAQVAESLFEKLNITNVHIHIGQFENILPESIKSISKLDFAFIDGHHRYKPTLQYFNLLLSKVKPDSCFVFDDIHWSAEMEKAWNEITDNEAVTVSIDLFRFGIVFFNKELSRQKFVIR